MNLEKRVEQLEARAGTDDDFMLIVVSFVGCHSEGRERPIEEHVTGYRSVGSNREWRPEEGESLENLRHRIASELRRDGRRVDGVCEVGG